MKLFLSLLVMITALVGLIILLRPARKKTRQIQAQRKPQTIKSASPSSPKPIPEKSADESPNPQREPTDAEIRFAVRKFAEKFPAQTASVLQDWAGKKK